MFSMQEEDNIEHISNNKYQVVSFVHTYAQLVERCII